MTTPGTGPATVGLRGSELLSNEHDAAAIDTAIDAAMRPVTRTDLRIMTTNPPFSASRDDRMANELRSERERTSRESAERPEGWTPSPEPSGRRSRGYRVT